MNFIHDDPEFQQLLTIVASARGLGVALVEKDYWVTHTLWALHQQGFDVWFKGGTSLSKGFELIERFSEDLDLKIEPGRLDALPAVTNWKSEGPQATRERKAHFEKLAKLLLVPGAETKLDDLQDETFRSANLRVLYPGRNLGGLDAIMRPYVLLEVGSARVTPAVSRDMTSFVHAYLESQNQLEDYVDNRPRDVRCVHPLVTLLEKLDALMRKLPNDVHAPASFVRHFEDAARIARALPQIAAIDGYASARALAEEMCAQKQIKRRPASTDPAFAPDKEARWAQVEKAHAAIAPMFWGPRLSLEEACADIRTWLRREIE